MKLGKVLGGLALAAWPVGAWAQNADLDALLAQVPAPPVKIGAADLRWKPGDDVNGSQAHFDKDATALLAKLDQLEKAEQTGQFSYGGDSPEEMQKKMASMSQQEKMAYAMQLAKKAQADQRAAYQGSNARVLAQAQQNDVDLVHKGLASEKAAKEMSDLDAQYNAKFDALLTRMLDDVKQCPTVTQGEASGPQKACVQGILDRYGKDYRALAEAKMAAYHAIYLEFKKGATAEIKGWESDIDSLKGDGSETAKDQIARKKMLIYEDILQMTVPADNAVNLGHDAATLDPWRVCGGNCVID